MVIPELCQVDFVRVQRFLTENVGLHLADSKQHMVRTRLHRRLLELGLEDFGGYLDRAFLDRDELSILVDLLTTHETSWFREADHFEVLVKMAAERKSLSMWSAACSTGEEVWTAAMVLRDAGARDFQILGSDVAKNTVRKAARAIYPMRDAHRIPTHLLHNYCLQGKGPQRGSFMVSDELRGHVSFRQLNLIHRLDLTQTFDVVFLRNVLIYFDAQGQRAVTRRVVERLRPGGLFLVGSAESIPGLHAGLEPCGRAAFRKRVSASRELSA